MSNVKFTEFSFVSTGTTTPRTQPARNAQYIMLEDFGGVGDSTTDNVAAFNAAVAALGTQAITINLDSTKGYAFNSDLSMPLNWSIDGHVGSTSPGPLPGLNSWNSAQAKAVGYFRFNKNPVNGETITLNGTTVTFVTGVAVGNQVQIAVDMNTTIANLVTFLNASADAQISKCTYLFGSWLNTQLQGSQPASATMAICEVTFDTVGVTGNSFTVATHSVSAPFIVVSGPATVTHGTSFLSAQNNSTVLRYGGLPTLGGTIILNSGATLSLQRSCALKNLYIVSGSIQSTFAGPANALATIAAFSGIGITGVTFTSQCVLKNICVIGFDTAYTGSHVSESIFDSIMLDCRNGLDISATFGTYSVSNVYANTKYTGSYTGDCLLVDTTYRKGVFISASEGSCGPFFVNCTNYGHAIKYLSGNEFDLQWVNCYSDGPSPQTITPCLLDFTLTAGGSGYTSAPTATCSPSKGEQLKVTILGGLVRGVTVIDPGTWDGSETPPVVTFTGGGGTGAAVSTAFIRTIGFSSYGNNVGRYTYINPGAALQTYGCKFEGTGATHNVHSLSWSSDGTATSTPIGSGPNSTCWYTGEPATSIAGNRMANMFVGRVGGTTAFGIIRGTGSPEGVYAADIGSLFLNTSGGAGTTLYVKQTGAGTNTGWIGK